MRTATRTLVAALILIGALAFSAWRADSESDTDHPPHTTADEAPEMTTTLEPICDPDCVAWVTAHLEREQAAIDEYVLQAEINAAARDGNAFAIVAVADRVTDAWDLDWVVATIGRETGHTWDPYAENPTSSASGLFQLLDGWAYLLPESTGGICPPSHEGGFYDAVCNIHAAAELFTMPGGGPSHWVVP